MDWFGFGRKSSLPQATPLQQQRSKQIETLKQSNQSIREIQRDLEYRLTIACSNGVSISLHLILPTNFPQDKPRVTVSPTVRHPWVDGTSMTVVGASLINNFTVHSDLSRAVREIVNEFQSNPPIPLQSPPPLSSASAVSTTTGAIVNGYASASSLAGLVNPPYPTMATAAMGTTLVSSSQLTTSQPSSYQPLGTFNEHHFATNHSPSPPPGLFPPVPSVIPSLRDKTYEELTELCKNDGSLYACIMEMPDIKCLETNRIKILQQTEDLAKWNIDRKPRLEELMVQLNEKHKELVMLNSNVEQKLSIQAEKSDARSPAHLQDKLKIAVMEADEESETIASEFLDGNLPLDQFLKNYKSKRKLSHMRKAQEEKLGQLVYSGQIGEL